MDTHDEKYRIHRIGSPPQWRSFGLLVGIIFLLIGLWPMIWSLPPRQWALIIGGALAFLGVALPSALQWPYRVWMAIGLALGWFNTRLILGLVFLLIVTPMGICKRVFGGDPLHLRWGKEDSYSLKRSRRDSKHMSGQF